MNGNVRFFAGGRPDSEDGWSFIDETTLAGVTWRVFTKPANDERWLTVRVVAAGRAPRKANYWLSWNGERWAQGREYFLVRAHQPDLSAWLDLLALTHGFRPEPVAA